MKKCRSASSHPVEGMLYHSGHKLRMRTKCEWPALEPAWHKRGSLYTHCQTDIDLDGVVDVFAKKHPRRLELVTLLKGQQSE